MQSGINPAWRGIACLIIFLLVACGGPDQASNVDTADLIVVNADIRTVDGKLPLASAFAVKDGKFIAVGNNKNIEVLAGATTRRIDAAGNTVVPGFIDGHTHLLMGAEVAIGVDLTGLPDRNDWRRRINEKVSQLPPGQWLIGGAWDHNLGPDNSLPNKAMLDEIAPDNPVALRDIDGHSTWVNSLVLDLAGITADTPVPAGGEIILGEDGEPSGLLLEGASYGLRELAGYRNAFDAKTGLKASIGKANSLGMTSVHDMSDTNDTYLSILADGDLTLRVWQGNFIRNAEDSVASGNQQRDPDPSTLLAELAAERDRIATIADGSEYTKKNGPLFALGYVKYVIDGVLSTRTALMQEPYADDPQADPDPFVTPERLEAMVAAAHAQDFPVAVHAIGDRSVAWVLDAFEVSSERPASLLPDRIEHIEIVTPDDVGRFRELGVTASMQPHHATCCMGNYVIDRIGNERVPNAFVWRSMLDTGVNLVLGTDWPTATFDPILQIADAVFRVDVVAANGLAAWDEGMTLNFDEALYAYTQAGANMTPWADQIGSISVGKYADFVILDGAIPTPVDRSLLQRRVSLTFLAGEEVYAAGQ
jgi:predicted amidohydrolase YtcJ